MNVGGIFVGLFIVAFGVVMFRTRIRLSEFNRTIWGYSSEVFLKFNIAISAVLATLMVACGVILVLVGLGFIQ